MCAVYGQAYKHIIYVAFSQDLIPVFLSKTSFYVLRGITMKHIPGLLLFIAFTLKTFPRRINDHTNFMGKQNRILVTVTLDSIHCQMARGRNEL